jgi:16S rRNA (adenine1518-N6/adenine1519-N6)-dimethyltransferase
MLRCDEKTTRHQVPCHLLKHRPSKALGQNFLIDDAVVKKSLLLSDIVPGECVVEIGPGFGVLTEQLLRAQADVYAIELDEALCDYIKNGLGRQFKKQLHLMRGDAVKFPIASFDAARPYKVIANLPYSITSHWLDAILKRQLPKSMTIIIQAETAERLFLWKNPKRYCPIAIRLEAAFENCICYPVSPQCFRPRPKVQSAIVSVKMRNEPYIFSALTQKIMLTCFNFRRKQLSGIIARIDNLHEKSQVQMWLEKLCSTGDISKHIRAEDVPLSAWKTLDGYMKTPDAAV